jgi:hypothetical protein
MNTPFGVGHKGCREAPCYDFVQFLVYTGWHLMGVAEVGHSDVSRANPEFHL